MIIDDGLKEDITVYSATSTISEDGVYSYSNKVVKGLWIDSDKIIQTGLQTSIKAKSEVILFEEFADNIKLQRGTSGEIHPIIKKQVCRSVIDGTFEGIVIYL